MGVSLGVPSWVIMAATQESSLSLPTPNSFPAFPFNPPYSIQVELMRHLYSAIEHRQVSIAESPTGTVSSYSPQCLRIRPNVVPREKPSAYFLPLSLGWMMTSTEPAKASSTLCQVTMVGATIRQMICFYIYEKLSSGVGYFPDS